MNKNLHLRAALLTVILVVSMIVAVGFGSIEIQTGIVADEIFNCVRGQSTANIF